MKKEEFTITQEEKEMFDYLNELRDSGVTNMHGAGPYLENQFDIERKESSRILTSWMKHFNSDGYNHLLKE